MKVLLLNGSPNAAGCTFTALTEVAGALAAEGIEGEIVQLGNKPVQGCIGCKKCKVSQRCVFDDGVNRMLERMEQADGLVIGAPVYYASPNGAMLSFLDRMFYTGGGNLHHKPGAAVVSARRAGTTASLDVLLKYFLISNMPVAPSCYWAMVHGNTPQEVRQDAEGLQVMRMLGRNLAWMLRCFGTGGPPPAMEETRLRTNFIR